MNFFKVKDVFIGYVSIICMVLIGLANMRQIEAKNSSNQVIEDNNKSFFVNAPSRNDNFWKIFMGGLSESFKEPETKMPHEKIVAIITALNGVSDAFNKEYSFTEFDQSLIEYRLTKFLENPQNKFLLNEFLKTFKDNAADFSDQFSSVAAKLEQSVNNKDATQFDAIYSRLEHHFRGLGIKPLIRIGKAGWGTTVSNIKDTVMNKARKVYDYLFLKKSPDSNVISKHIIRYDDSTGKAVSYEKMISK